MSLPLVLDPKGTDAEQLQAMLHWPRGADTLALQAMSDSQFILGLEWGPRAQWLAWQQRRFGELMNHLTTFLAWQRWFGGVPDRVPVQQLPIMKRSDFRAMSDALGDAEPAAPEGHGWLRMNHTAGTTGVPLKVWSTEFSERMNQAQFAADHARQGRSPNDHVALIAPRIPEHDGQHLAVPPNHWLGSGQIHLRSSEKTDALGHAQWLASLGAQYLSLTPQLLSGLLEVFEDGKLKPVGFKQVLTHGQAVDRLLRERTQATFGAQIRDRYTLEEVGLVAVQCPHSSAHWHTAVSNVMVEAVKADGKPVKDGEAGRILVTGLHQFASAVVRYDTGDWATFHHECPACGATVPTLSRLIGVPRLWLVTPSGQRLRPRLTAAHWRAVGPVVEHRLVQIASNQVQCQITAERRLDEAELQAAQSMLTQVVSPEFTYQVVQHAAIDWPTGVKRLDVENLLLG